MINAQVDIMDSYIISIDTFISDCSGKFCDICSGYNYIDNYSGYKYCRSIFPYGSIIPYIIEEFEIYD